MTKDAARTAFKKAEQNAKRAVDLFAQPIGGGARQSIEHQGIQALAEAVRDLAHGLQELDEESS
jgi:ubiquinone biosynthesis protein UbiJ